MNLLDVEITTSRLLLKPIALEYKDEIFSEFTGKIVREYAGLNQMGKVLHLVEYRIYK